MAVALDIDAPAVERFACLGGECSVLVEGTGPAGRPGEAAARARRRLEDWHQQFSRFEPASELSALNRDRRRTVPVSSVMARFVEAALEAATMTGGLVDPTLGEEIERVGYRDTLDRELLDLTDALQRAPRRAAGAPDPKVRWREVQLDAKAAAVIRPPGLRLDSGGIAKGLFGDVLSSVLCLHRCFVIDAAGDVCVGGVGGVVRDVHVASPFDDSTLHIFELARGAAATSGISKRSWLGTDGRPAHHLLDPATGAPAFTGVVQATALAPTGVEGEALSKAALLSGAAHARSWLVHGGVIVYEDRSVEIVDPPAGRFVP